MYLWIYVRRLTLNLIIFEFSSPSRDPCSLLFCEFRLEKSLFWTSFALYFDSGLPNCVSLSIYLVVVPMCIWYRSSQYYRLATNKTTDTTSAFCSLSNFECCSSHAHVVAKYRIQLSPNNCRFRLSHSRYLIELRIVNRVNDELRNVWSSINYHKPNLWRLITSFCKPV